MKRIFSVIKPKYTSKSLLCNLLVLIIFITHAPINVLAVDTPEKLPAQLQIETETSPDQEDIIVLEEMFTVSFDTKQGVPTVIEPIAVVAGESITLPYVSKPGNEFTNWTVSALQGGAIAGAIGASYTPTRDIELWAGWWQPTVTVTFNPNYVEAQTPFPKTQIQLGQTYSSAIASVDAPTRLGYNFVAWFEESSCINIVHSTTLMQKQTDHSLYAGWSPEPVVVTYNGAGGSVSHYNSTVVYGAPYGQLATATKTGYDFSGWYTQEGDFVNQATIVTIATDHILTAGWKAKAYTVTFQSAGGMPEQQTSNLAILGGTYAQAIAEVSQPVKTGYDFSGWYTQEGDFINQATIVTATADHTLYAHWKSITFTVSFNKNAADATQPVPASKLVTIDSTYGALPTIKRQGYSFAGWFTSSNLDNGVKIQSNSPVTNPNLKELFAGWVPEKNGVELTFDASDGEFLDFSSTTVTVGERYANNPESSLAPIAKTGHKFLGWYTQRENGLLITDDTIVTNNYPHTLYAHWRVKDDILVTFEENEGTPPTISSMKVTYGHNYGDFGSPTGTLPESLREGYIFDGWYTDKTDGEKILPDTVVLSEYDHDLYAHWQAIDDISVTFDGDGGSPVPPDRLVTFDKPYGSFPSITKAGMSFDGWYTDTTMSSRVFAFTHVKDVKDHTLYAHWTPAQGAVIVTFDNMGGSDDPEMSDKKVTFGEEYGLLAMPTRYGYDFVSWHLDINTTPESTVNSTTIVDNNLSHTLYCKWAVKTNITATFDAKDATPYAQSFKVTYGESYSDALQSALAPVKLGYNFIGWYKSQYGNIQITDQSIVLNEDDHTVYSHWKAKEVTIHFDTNGATLQPLDKKVLYNSQYGTLPAPTKAGYKFDGWYTLATGGDKITSTTIVAGPSDLQTIFAHWTANIYKISLDENGGNPPAKSEIEVQFGQDYGGGQKNLSSAITTRIGYDFNGWFLQSEDGQGITDDTISTIPNDHTLYAQWTAQKVNVIFNSNSGQSTTIQTASATFDDTYAKAMASIQYPTRIGYTFDGWYKTTTSNIEITGESIVKRPTEHTLYAHWKADLITVIFNPNDEHSTQEKQVKFGDVYGELPTLKRAGYGFGGWFADNESFAVQILDSTTVSNASTPQQLYAKWTPLPDDVTILFNANGGNSVYPSYKNATVLDTYGAKIPLPIPTRTGYEFTHWSSVKAGGTIVENTTIITNANNHWLYAQWKAKSDIAVTFDTNDGEPLEPSPILLVTFGQPYSLELPFPTPTRTGYIFDGWYTPLHAMHKVVTQNSPVEIDTAHSLHAHWKRDDIKVNFDKNAIDAISPTPPSKEVEFAGRYGDLPLVQRYGYNFVGWYTSRTGGETITSESIVTNNNEHTLYAQWTAKNNIKVTFVNGSGTTNFYDSIRVTFGTEYGRLGTAYKKGYSFDGWYTERVNGHLVTNRTLVDTAGDHNLYAHYKKNSLINPIIPNSPLAPPTIPSQIENPPSTPNIIAPSNPPPANTPIKIPSPESKIPRPANVVPSQSEDNSIFIGDQDVPKSDNDINEENCNIHLAMIVGILLTCVYAIARCHMLLLKRTTKVNRAKTIDYIVFSAFCFMDMMLLIFKQCPLDQLLFAVWLAVIAIFLLMLNKLSSKT